MGKNQKVLFVGQNLCVGGVQTAFINHLNKFSKDPQYDITVFLFSKGALYDQMPDNINVIFGNALLQLISLPFSEVKASKNMLKTLIRAGSVIIARLIGVERFYRMCFKKLSSKYDIAISYFTDGLNGTFNRGTNLFVSEYVDANTKVAWIHNDPILAKFDYDYCKKLYLPFDKIVCVSDAVREKFNEFLPAYKDKTLTFHNVFDEEKIKSLAKEYVPFEKAKSSAPITTAQMITIKSTTRVFLRTCFQEGHVMFLSSLLKPFQADFALPFFSLSAISFSSQIT